jgi:hypothetical protein
MSVLFIPFRSVVNVHSRQGSDSVKNHESGHPGHPPTRAPRKRDRMSLDLCRRERNLLLTLSPVLYWASCFPRASNLQEPAAVPVSSWSISKRSPSPEYFPRRKEASHQKSGEDFGNITPEHRTLVIGDKFHISNDI